MKKLTSKIHYNNKIKLEKVLDKFKSSMFFIVTDDNLLNIYNDYLKDTFSNYNYQIITVLEKEKSKTLEEYQNLTNELLLKGITRKDIIVAFGGGSIGDLAGFVSATILRGVKFINIPTTLLAMVDSCIGGKVGINTKYGKNLIGAFKESNVVFINTNLLKTLPKSELINGYAEIVKTSFILDRKMFNYIDEEQYLEKLIKRAQKLKQSVVKKDFFEKGKRMILNFGHTFGHAIEKKSNYEISHGIAVFQGMEIALRIGIALSVTEESDLDLLYYFFDKYEIGPFKGDLLELTNLIKFDKKIVNDYVNFVLIKKNAVIYEIKVDFLYELLR